MCAERFARGFASARQHPRLQALTLKKSRRDAETPSMLELAWAAVQALERTPPAMTGSCEAAGHWKAPATLLFCLVEAWGFFSVELEIVAALSRFLVPRR